MRNKYPGICYRCGELVKKGEGHFERHQGRWRVQHAECAIIYREIGRHHKKEATNIENRA